MYPLFCYQVVFENSLGRPVPRFIGHVQLVDVSYYPMQFVSTSMASVIVFAYTAADAVTMAELIMKNSVPNMELRGVYPIDGTINRKAHI